MKSLAGWLSADLKLRDIIVSWAGHHLQVGDIEILSSRYWQKKNLQPKNIQDMRYNKI